MTGLRILAGVLAAMSLAAGLVAAEKAEKANATEQPLDKVMGDYVGTYTPAGGAETKAEAKVIAEGGGNYFVALLPAASGAAAARLEVKGKGDAKKVALAGKVGDAEWAGSIEDGKLSAQSKDGKFDLKATVKKSPTEGAKPPAGAVVLIPFAEGKPPSMDEWTNPAWEPQADGSVLVVKGDNRTKRQFGDMQLHLEFRIPFEPGGRGQGRGNSGVYIQDLYEIQILDSYGLVAKAGDCGAVYTQTPPKENACLPPGSWQTYDITFRAPRFDADGKKVKDVTVTVIQNGVKIHDEQKISGPTGAAKGRPEVKKAVLRLQEHGHAVRIRNVWLAEVDEREAAR